MRGIVFIIPADIVIAGNDDIILIQLLKLLYPLCIGCLLYTSYEEEADESLWGLFAPPAGNALMQVI